MSTAANAASTYQLKVLEAGSSAQYGVFAEAAYQLAKLDGSAKHYTVNGTAKIHDARSASIPDESGNIWVVWSDTTGNVWAYISVDSTVGVRAFEALATLTFPATAPSAGNTLPVWDDASTDTALPALVTTLLNAGPTIQAANTDIRPEDALFATNRALATLNTTDYSGLDYGSGVTGIGNPIKSGVTGSTSTATPVLFALGGTDPIKGTQTAPTPITLPVGAAPIVFIANKSNTASGHLGNSAVANITVNTTNNALKLFSGDECDASLVGGSASVPVTVMLREPLSGTMNTTEFTNFRFRTAGTTSQEKNVDPSVPSDNGLNKNCTSVGGVTGKRIRGIGTGQVVSSVNSTADAIGYAFFAYEALNTKTGGNAVNVKYLKLDGVDPILATASYTGTIPACGTTTFNCPNASPKATFPNLRNGTYRSWSTYRVITDSTHQTNVQALIKKAESVADTTLPDFVPFTPQCGTTSSKDDPGLGIYRAHFSLTGITTSPTDGPLGANVTCTTGGTRTLKTYALGGTTEAGGDVGGAVVYFDPALGVQPSTSTNNYINQYEGQNSTLPQLP
jgi:ABC-type phosphate transport system substrate-binding protein